jgi:LPS-assembly protein
MFRVREPKTQTGSRRTVRALRAFVMAWLCAALVFGAGLPSLTAPVMAQDPSLVSKSGKQSSFGNTKDGIFGGTPRKIDKSQPLLLQADELIHDSRANRVIARGNVEAYYNNYVLTADQVIYDQNANTISAEGNAKLVEPNGNVVRGDRLDATGDFRDAFVQSLSLVTKDETRIAARRFVRKDGNVSEFEQGKFTPCKSEDGMPPLWCISASRIVHDQQAASITYQDAQFELFGVPVFYMPYFQHGDPSAKRRTGFLLPEFHQSSTLGYGTEIPYYFALSPYYDFTFHPTWWSKHGVLYKGDWRHRVAYGSIRGDYYVKLSGIEQDGSTLPSDLTPERRKLYDGWRGSLETRGTFSLSSWWKFGWDITLESDDAFRRFYKLDNLLQTDRVNKVWLEGLSDRNYFGAKLYHFGGLLIEDTPASESRVLPVIDYRYIVDQPVLGGELAFNANALSLTRNDGTDISRVAAETSWRRKLIDPIGQTWTPYLQARGDVSAFTNGYDPDTFAPVPEDTITRGMATAALTYAYPWIWHGTSAAHTIEPIAQIIARPAHVSQRRLPDEDARSIVWADTLLFDINKFSGWDRIETGTRANLGLQYTMQANSGGYVRLVAGQSLHLAGENPYTNPGQTPTGPNGALAYNFSPSTGLNTDRSDYVLGAYIAPTSAFKMVAQSRFDEAELSLRRQDLHSAINLGPVHLGAQYSYMREDPVVGINKSEHELIGSATLKLTDHWSVTGLLRYDLDEKAALQEGILVRYSDECFVLTAQYTETHINNPELYIKPDRSLMLRFEWKYLGEQKYTASGIDQQFQQGQPISSSVPLPATTTVAP